MLEKEFGRWGRFSATAADLVLEVVDLEGISPELLAYTFCKESVFVLNPMPNDNNHPECVHGYDVGPGQLNVLWCYKSIWVGEYSNKGLHYDQVFGKELARDGKPIAFTGSPLANLRMASRRLLARKGDDEARATLYPGPNSRPNRQQGWKKYGHLFREFFQAYKGDSK